MLEEGLDLFPRTIDPSLRLEITIGVLELDEAFDGHPLEVARGGDLGLGQR